MQILGTLHFVSFKVKQSVSIEHGRNSQGTIYIYINIYILFKILKLIIFYCWNQFGFAPRCPSFVVCRTITFKYLLF